MKFKVAMTVQIFTVQYSNSCKFHDEKMDTNNLRTLQETSRNSQSHHVIKILLVLLKTVVVEPTIGIFVSSN